MLYLYVDRLTYVYSFKITYNNLLLSKRVSSVKLSVKMQFAMFFAHNDIFLK